MCLFQATVSECNLCVQRHVFVSPVPYSKAQPIFYEHNAAKPAYRDSIPKLLL